MLDSLSLLLLLQWWEVLWRDLTYFPVLYEINQALTGAVDLDFLPQAKLGLLIVDSLHGDWRTFFYVVFVPQ